MTVLVTGGTGRLGALLVDGLLGAGGTVRVLTRSAASAGRLRSAGVEAVQGDARDRGAVERAVRGCSTVISAMSGFGPMGASTPANVDRDGNLTLLRAAVDAGVRRFLLVSAHGAARDARIPLLRMKFVAEEALRDAPLAWTIIRPTSYLETQLDAVAAPLARRGSTLTFGSGRVPANFVSVHDVAALVLRAVQDDSLAGRTIELGGPDLTLSELSRALHERLGTSGATRRVPRGALRVLASAARPFSPFLARVAQAALVLDTTDMRFDPAPDRATVPGLPLSTLAEVVGRRA